MRDRAHLLLVEHLDRIDAVYARLSPEQRESIARCVRDMAVGMREGNGDVLAYCRTVLGNPVVFALELLLDRRLDDDERETAMRVSEMVQLANITRDIEKDLGRGVVYDARLADNADEATVRAVRDDLMRMASSARPTTGGCSRCCAGRASVSGVRRRCSCCSTRAATTRAAPGASATKGWSAPRSTVGFFVRVFPAAFSHRYAMRAARRIERSLLGALQTKPY